MEARLTPINRAEDAPDRELFERMIKSHQFALYQERVAAELRRAEEACVNEDSPLTVRRAQGRAAALRSVLRLPGLILSEMNANAVRPK